MNSQEHQQSQEQANRARLVATLLAEYPTLAAHGACFRWGFEGSDEARLEQLVEAAIRQGMDMVYTHLTGVGEQVHVQMRRLADVEGGALHEDRIIARKLT